MTYIVEIPTKGKAPNEVLDFLVRWTKWIGSETVVSSSFEITQIEGDSGTLVVDLEENSGMDRRVWLSGGVLDEVYLVVNKMTTTGIPARKPERSFYLRIIPK